MGVAGCLFIYAARLESRQIDSTIDGDKESCRIMGREVRGFAGIGQGVMALLGRKKAYPIANMSVPGVLYNRVLAASGLSPQDIRVEGYKSLLMQAESRWEIRNIESNSGRVYRYNAPGAVISLSDRVLALPSRALTGVMAREVARWMLPAAETVKDAEYEADALAACLVPAEYLIEAYQTMAERAPVLGEMRLDGEERPSFEARIARLEELQLTQARNGYRVPFTDQYLSDCRVSTEDNGRTIPVWSAVERAKMLAETYRVNRSIWETRRVPVDRGVANAEGVVTLGGRTAEWQER